MKILVVGCGSIGSRHAVNTSRFVETAVFDTDSKLCRECALRAGVKHFDDLKSALGWKPDGVIVAVPNNFHIPVATAAIESGADVLIEKPLSHTRKGVDLFLKKAADNKRKVFVVCNMRFHPAVETMHQNLNNIGRIYFARAHVGNYLPNMRPGADYRTLYCARRETGGGVILDAIHEIDYLMWFFGHVSKVECYADKISDLDIKVEDFASICLRHNTAISEIQMDYLRPFKRRGCEIVGSHGMILWMSEGKNPEICTVRLFKDDSGSWETIFHSGDIDANLPYEKLIAAFIDALNGKKTRLLKGVDAAEEISVAIQALKNIILPR